MSERALGTTWPPVDHADLYRAILNLPARQREVTTLRFMMGMPVKEAAEVLGCPVGTVKSNLHKALISLCDRVKGLEGLREL